jgi:hypothetical protein
MSTRAARFCPSLVLGKPREPLRVVVVVRDAAEGDFAGLIEHARGRDEGRFCRCGL